MAEVGNNGLKMSTTTKDIKSSPVNSSIAPNYVVTRPTKSIGIALVLALLFGPIGLFYASITGGIVMFFVCGIINAIGLLMMGLGLIVTIPLTGIMCAVWAYFSVSRYNEKLLSGQL